MGEHGMVGDRDPHGWISVDDDLPEIGQKVDLCVNGDVLDFAYTLDASDCGDLMIYFWYRETPEQYRGVSEGQYWRPRPNPPAKKEK